MSLDVSFYNFRSSNIHTYVQYKCTSASVYRHCMNPRIIFCMHVPTFLTAFVPLSAVVIDSYPPVTAVEQGESIVLVCRVVGVLPSVTLSYSWTCNGGTCEDTEVVSGNRLRISVLNSGNHGGMFRCNVTGSGVSVSGTFTLTVIGEKSTQSTFRICHMCVTATVAPIWYWLYIACQSAI